MNKINILLLTGMLLFPTISHAQTAVEVGKGSYASYTPLANSKSTTHSGDQSRMMQYKTLYMAERNGQPIPTNDWWTNLITDQYSGHLWSYPQFIQAQSYGLDIQRPSFWIENGTEMKSNTILSVSGEDFSPKSAVAETWHDWDVEFSMQDADKRFDVTMVHGMPFTWIEMGGVVPQISLANSSWTSSDFQQDAAVEILKADGTAISSESICSSFVMKKDKDIYGIYLPAGSEIIINKSVATIHFSGDKQYIAVAPLHTLSDLKVLDTYAYSIPRSTTVSWKYNMDAGKVQTYWDIQAESLNGESVNVLQGFLPHQYRDTGNDGLLKFTDLNYVTPRGKLKMAQGTHFEIDYNFNGMLPYYAMPSDTTGVTNPYDEVKMKTMLDYYANNGTFGDDTYWGGKGLTQMALNMMFARESGDTILFEKCHDRLKEKLVDWYTFTPGEKNHFFARYDRWGGLVGYSTSYDSDTFNDHHFHYGYFTLASALLALVDQDFRDNYGQMARQLVKDYANWDHQDTSYPFFRTFDPWAGHSFAGGMGDDNGNGQESSSEAMQSWGGMYLLGVALGDDEMRDAGLFGWVSEARGVAEYWFDRHTDAAADYTLDKYHTQTAEEYNIPYSKFTSTYTDLNGVKQTIIPPYNSNLTCHGVGWWTYFGYDAIYMQGIQWMPISPALDYLSENKQFAAWDYARLMRDKMIGGWIAAEANKQGAYLGASGGWGNVVLSYLQRSNPDEAARIFDTLWQDNNSECSGKSGVGTNGITYFVTHSHRSHGDLDWTVTANYPTARCFNKNGTKTYQIFNPTDKDLTVTFSTGYSHTVSPHELFISDYPNRKAVPYIQTAAVSGDVRDSIGMENLALHKTVTASSTENVGTVISNATDGDYTTRWGSSHEDNQWISVDLGEKCALYQLKLYWEAAYASEYNILVSDDGNTWTSVKTVTSDGGKDEVKMGDVSARYIKIIGLQRATQYGISLYEIEAYGLKASLTDDDILGIRITADKDMLKQGQPSQLTAKGYTIGGKWCDVDVAWTTEDGSVSTSGIFTPTVYGSAKVKASTGNLSVEKILPVEEAVVPVLFTVSPKDVSVVVGGDKQTYSFSATDQFGTPFYVSQSDMVASVYSCGEDKKLTLTTQALYNENDSSLSASHVGDYAIVFTYGSLVDTVYVHAKNLSDINLALHKPTKASSGTAGTLATDGDMTTRWESQWKNDDENLTVDLQAIYKVDTVKVDWEGAAASKYDIETSIDGVNWNTSATAVATSGGWVSSALNYVDTRFVRIQGRGRLLEAYGYSIFELEVYGSQKVDIPTSLSVNESRDNTYQGYVYTLSGQRIDSEKNLIHGIYVKNGKKIISSR